jgi:hypothetical protein
VLDYAMMVEDSHVETRIIEYRKRSVDRHHRRGQGDRGGADGRAQRRWYIRSSSRRSGFAGTF